MFIILSSHNLSKGNCSIGELAFTNIVIIGVSATTLI